MTITIQHEKCTAAVGGQLLMSMELGRRQWTLGFTTGVGQRPRRRTLSTDMWDRLPEEIAAAKRRFRLPAGAPVLSCYEAGRDGFWIHPYLTSLGVDNLVVDSSSIEVDRRARRAKTDRLDLTGLLNKLARYVQGDRRGWRTVRVPTVIEEDAPRTGCDPLVGNQLSVTILRITTQAKPVAMTHKSTRAMAEAPDVNHSAQSV